MPHIEPLSREDLPDFEPLFQLVEATMGFVPNSLLTLARKPDILRAFSMLVGSVLGPAGSIDPGLKQLVAYVASNATGCRYCQAHTAHGAVHRGVSPEKLDAAFEFETNPAFDDAERAALRLARDSALLANEVTADHFAALRRHFSEEQIVELVAVSALFAWLNRWNDTLATELEALPRSFAESSLAARGWSVAKHAPPGSRSR